MRTPQAGSYLFPRLPKLSVPLHDFVRALRITGGCDRDAGHRVQSGCNRQHSPQLLPEPRRRRCGCRAHCDNGGALPGMTYDRSPPRHQLDRWTAIIGRSILDTSAFGLEHVLDLVRASSRCALLMRSLVLPIAVARSASSARISLLTIGRKSAVPTGAPPPPRPPPPPAARTRRCRRRVDLAGHRLEIHALQATTERIDRSAGLDFLPEAVPQVGQHVRDRIHIALALRRGFEFEHALQAVVAEHRAE